VACDFFEFVDPEYTSRSMEVIDQMVDKRMETQDWMLGDHNERFWANEEEMKVEDGLRLEIMKLKTMLSIALSVIIMLIAITISTRFGKVNSEIKDFHISCSNIHCNKMVPFAHGICKRA